LTKDFQRALGLRYSLMPYIYAQAKDSSARGFPMVRALFFEYPNDPGSWNIDDEYMFGSDLLVAPMFESGERRKVYLPPGEWIDYQSGKVYEGAKWHDIALGPIPVVLLVKNHTVLPHIKVAQSTQDMDWDNVELRVFSTDSAPVSGLFTRPDSGVQTLSLTPSGSSYVLGNDPQAGKVKWIVRTQTLTR
jgi:alpha-D-xyloside xylohydrolase